MREAPCCRSSNDVADPQFSIQILIGLFAKKHLHTEASGTLEARTITTEWHLDYRLPVRTAEPDRITEYTYDEQGRKLPSKISGVQ